MQLLTSASSSTASRALSMSPRASLSRCCALFLSLRFLSSNSLNLLTLSLLSSCERYSFHSSSASSRRTSAYDHRVSTQIPILVEGSFQCWQNVVLPKVSIDLPIWDVGVHLFLCVNYPESSSKSASQQIAWKQIALIFRGHKL